MEPTAELNCSLGDFQKSLLLSDFSYWLLLNAFRNVLLLVEVCSLHPLIMRSAVRRLFLFPSFFHNNSALAYGSVLRIESMKDYMRLQTLIDGNEFSSR